MVKNDLSFLGHGVNDKIMAFGFGLLEKLSAGVVAMLLLLLIRRIYNWYEVKSGVRTKSTNLEQQGGDRIDEAPSDAE